MIKKIIYTTVAALLAAALSTGFVCETASIAPSSIHPLFAMFMQHASPMSLAAGILFAQIFGKVFGGFTQKMSKKMLQYSVVGLGFGMTLSSAFAAGKEGMLFTIISVFGTLWLGWLIGVKLLKVDWQTGYLIGSGTAICGGSAIASTAPVINAKNESISVALGVVFVLNAVALFIFPLIGDAIGMNMKEFGMWAAIAIHDTSSVVGAGAAFDASHPEMMAAEGVSALQTATAIKLTRALWIVILVLATPFLLRRRIATTGRESKPLLKTIPPFILWFVAVILLNTFVLQQFETGEAISRHISIFAKHTIALSLFFTGCSLTKETLRAVGIRPLLQGIALWVAVSAGSLAFILWAV